MSGTARPGLFAALNTATGKVIGKLSAQHRAIDFRDFLDQIDRQTDPGLDVHLICDNLRAQGTPGAALAASPPALRAALHSHVLVVDQPGRTLAGRTAAALPGPRDL